jgi:hypothetical protein
LHKGRLVFSRVHFTPSLQESQRSSQVTLTTMVTLPSAAPLLCLALARSVGGITLICSFPVRGHQQLQQESSKQSLQEAALTSGRKHPGWAHCAHGKEETQLSLSALHLLLDDGDINHHDCNQFLADAGLLKKPRWDSHARAVDTWEAFCATCKIHRCEPTAMHFSNVRARGQARNCQLFLGRQDIVSFS